MCVMNQCGPNMSYYSFYRQCDKFCDVHRSNVHDVRKVCLEMTLCVFACFIQCYALVLDEIYMRGHKLVYDNIRVGNIKENIPKGGTLYKRKKLSRPAPKDRGYRRQVGLSMHR